MEHEKGVVFLRGKRVILRPLNKETDLPSILRWINDPETRQFIAAYLPSSLEAEEQWLDDLLKKKASDIVLAIETLDGVFIGTMGIHQINWKDRVAVTGALIGEKEYWGKGYGTDAKMALLDYAFNTLNLHKLCSAVVAFNQRSLHYSLKCGYKIEGKRRRQFFKDGKYHDEIVLGVFRSEWLTARKKWLHAQEKKTGK
jgi:RimJ/RimL family protein N-acetyltransferase